jgi:hypothetical protein
MSGDKLTIDHYVAECFIKCATVILSSRIYQENPIPPDKRASRWVRALLSRQCTRPPTSLEHGKDCSTELQPTNWYTLSPCCLVQFLLSVDEVEGVAKDVEPWRKDTSNPMVIEVMLYVCSCHQFIAASYFKTILMPRPRPCRRFQLGRGLGKAQLCHRARIMQVCASMRHILQLDTACLRHVGCMCGLACVHLTAPCLCVPQAACCSSDGRCNTAAPLRKAAWWRVAQPLRRLRASSVSCTASTCHTLPLWHHCSPAPRPLQSYIACTHPHPNCLSQSGCCRGASQALHHHQP